MKETRKCLPPVCPPQGAGQPASSTSQTNEQTVRNLAKIANYI